MENTIESTQTIHLSRLEIFLALNGNVTRSSIESILILEKYISEKLHCNCSLNAKSRRIFRHLNVLFKKKLDNIKGKGLNFFQYYQDWLSETSSFPICQVTQPELKVEDCSAVNLMSSSKYAEIVSLTYKFDISDLLYAAQIKFHSLGNTEAAKSISTMLNPEKPKKDYYAIYKKPAKPVEEMTTSKECALAFLLDQGLSKQQYLAIRRLSHQYNCKMLPAYTKVKLAKENCYSLRKYIKAYNNIAEVRLQALLDNTIERLLFALKDVIKRLILKDNVNMTFSCIWSYDIFYEKRNNDNDSKSNVNNIILTSLIPQELTFIDTDNKDEVEIWVNSYLSYVQYCRPIRLQFGKESMHEPEQYIEMQEQKLDSHVVTLDNKTIVISYHLNCNTMDGQVCSAFVSPSLIEGYLSNQIFLFSQSVKKQKRSADYMKRLLSKLFVVTDPYMLSFHKNWSSYSEEELNDKQIAPVNEETISEVSSVSDNDEIK